MLPGARNRPAVELARPLMEAATGSQSVAEPCVSTESGEALA